MVREEHSLEFWEQIFKEFEALGTKLYIEIRHSGNIASRPGIRIDEPLPNRIAHSAKDDRVGGRGLLRRFCLCIAEAKEDVHPVPYQLSSHSGQNGTIPLCEADANYEILILAVAHGT
jgi:hypothetical protein